MSPAVIDTFEQVRTAAEQRLQQRNEANRTRIQVGSATCENAAGARVVLEEFQRHITASGRDDIVLRQVGCTGRCSCEPIVGIYMPGQMPVKYEHVDRDLVHEIFTSHVQQNTTLSSHVLDSTTAGDARYELMVCRAGNCGLEHVQDHVRALREALDAASIDGDHAKIIETNCLGMCRFRDGQSATHVLVRPGKIVYRITSKDDIARIVQEHLVGGQVVEELRVYERPISQRFFELYGDVAFFNRQSRIALRNSGIINPEDIDEYIHYNGFEALAGALSEGDPAGIIEQVVASNLRGRGGGGFPTGLKWKNAASHDADEKYVICNADEGDPGAFMDRSMLEGDPFSVVEGMIIGAYAVGATSGYLYIRAEYPLAIRRIQHAIDVARERGLLGENILNSSFSFDLEIRLGAGAFVCGEETALIHSIEGLRGQPRIRPPYPAESGLWGKPTLINNVETWANVPVILQYGPEWFRQIGTEKSGGTKVFALAGKVQHTGLVEVPMGTTLREIVFDIGGGVPDGRELKAIQTGGPAGGCLPASFLDTQVDFDTLMQAGSIMGSGGMIVMDSDDCMVDIAKYFISFSQYESCGKCTPCREGTTRMLEILERITSGKGQMEDLDKLERLAKLIKKASLCGLGRAAPNPVLSTLKHYRDEYEAHVTARRCPAKKCTSLIHYEINAEKCVGCTACARNCPVACISGKPKVLHVIDQDRCIKCGKCYDVCKFDAVDRN